METTTEPVGYANPSSYVIGYMQYFVHLLHNVLINNLISHYSPVVQPMQRLVLVKEDPIDGYAQLNFPCHHC